jgi:spore coat polysaccharide biosynthesis protein SpsF|tara:strand:- start:1286 stop:2020 length:735 start_codon:yes stop_codon:yes gene_type:complete
MKISAIIQSRMGSERLPGKSLMNVGRKPILQHIIENLKTSKKLSRIILATTDEEEDILLLKLAKKLDISGFAGSAKDVLARYTEAAENFKSDVVVRVTGDNILTDVDGMDQTIALYIKEKPDLATNGGNDGYPFGTVVEVLSTNLLQKLEKVVYSPEEKEHVTLNIHRQSEKYRISYLTAPVGFKDVDIRLTIDTPEDLFFIRELYRQLKKRGENFNLASVIKYVKEYPEIKKINSHIKQRCFL